MNGISPQLQNQITQFQQVQQQLQAVTTQKMQYDAQKRELSRTLPDPFWSRSRTRTPSWERSRNPSR